MRRKRTDKDKAGLLKPFYTCNKCGKTTLFYNGRYAHLKIKHGIILKDRSESILDEWFSVTEYDTQ